ncbi:MAG: MarR family transcriptional regulator [Rhodanobacteraceae bacterium]
MPTREIVLIRLIKHLSTVFSGMLNQRLRPLGFHEVSFRTLLMLYASSDHTVHPSELCTATGESRANMTRLCDDLCRKGLVRRRPSTSDRRRIRLELTARGVDTVEDMLPIAWRAVHCVNSALDADERTQLEGLLKRLLASAEMDR